eukprot:3545465-Prymnesium_polylepis.2
MQSPAERGGDGGCEGGEGGSAGGAGGSGGTGGGSESTMKTKINCCGVESDDVQLAASLMAA